MHYTNQAYRSGEIDMRDLNTTLDTVAMIVLVLLCNMFQLVAAVTEKIFVKLRIVFSSNSIAEKIHNGDMFIIKNQNSKNIDEIIYAPHPRKTKPNARNASICNPHHD
jgi:hypothetical protein